MSTGTDLTTQTYSVAGMTCGHCESAVVSEISAIDGVAAVAVDLVPDGLSSVTVSSANTVDGATIAAALAEAGDYRLA